MQSNVKDFDFINVLLMKICPILTAINQLENQPKLVKKKKLSKKPTNLGEHSRSRRHVRYFIPTFSWIPDFRYYTDDCQMSYQFHFYVVVIHYIVVQLIFYQSYVQIYLCYIFIVYIFVILAATST